MDGEDVDRFSPSAAAALVLLGLVMRDERAGVAWNDILDFAAGLAGKSEI